MAGFKDFIMRGNVVDLAVGVVIGAAFGGVVTAFTNAFINPLIAMLVGKPDFSKLAFTVNGATFPWGLFIGALFTFIVTALVIYYFVVQPVGRLMERVNGPKAPDAPPAPTNQEVLLTEIRDSLRMRTT